MPATVDAEEGSARGNPDEEELPASLRYERDASAERAKRIGGEGHSYDQGAVCAPATVLDAATCESGDIGLD